MGISQTELDVLLLKWLKSIEFDRYLLGAPHAKASFIYPGERTLNWPQELASRPALEDVAFGIMKNVARILDEPGLSSTTILPPGFDKLEEPEQRGALQLAHAAISTLHQTGAATGYVGAVNRLEDRVRITPHVVALGRGGRG